MSTTAPAPGFERIDGKRTGPALPVDDKTKAKGAGPAGQAGGGIAGWFKRNKKAALIGGGVLVAGAAVYAGRNAEDAEPDDADAEDRYGYEISGTRDTDTYNELQPELESIGDAIRDLGQRPGRPRHPNHPGRPGGSSNNRPRPRKPKKPRGPGGPRPRNPKGPRPRRGQPRRDDRPRGDKGKNKRPGKDKGRKPRRPRPGRGGTGGDVGRPKRPGPGGPRPKRPPRDRR